MSIIRAGGPVKTMDFVHRNVVQPSAGFNGTAGSGFGGSYQAVPVDPTRTTAKPVCRMLVPDRQAFTDKILVGVIAGANYLGSLMQTLGLSEVRFYYEGNLLTVTQPTWQSVITANGDETLVYGWWCWLKHNGINGVANLYVEAVPLDGTMQHRVMGPYAYVPRANLYDYQLEIWPSFAQIAGVRYQNLSNALDFLRTNNSKSALVTLMEERTDYVMNSLGIPYTGYDARVIVQADRPATFAATLAARTQFRPRHGGFTLRGENITLDMRYVSAVRLDDGTAPWMDGINIINSGGRNEYWDKGPRPSAYNIRGAAWFTDCHLQDLNWPCVTLNAANLVRGCRLQDCMNDVFTSAICVINTVTDDIDSTFYKNDLDSITISYSGPSATATVSLSGGNDDAARSLILRENGVAVRTLALQNTDPAGAMFDNADVVNDINTALGASGWTATLLDDTRRATSLGQQGTAGTTFSNLDCKTQPLTLMCQFDIHADWWQTNNLVENCALMGNIATGLITQDLFLTQFGVKDWLIINNLWMNKEPVAYISQFSQLFSHIVTVNNAWVNQQVWKRDLGGLYAADSYTLWANNVLPGFFSTFVDADETIVGNHVYTGGIETGTASTAGGDQTTVFEDIDSYNFLPAGELLSNLKTTVFPFDLNANRRGPTSSAGPFAG